MTEDYKTYKSTIRCWNCGKEAGYRMSYDTRLAPELDKWAAKIREITRLLASSMTFDGTTTFESNKLILKRLEDLHDEMWNT